MTEPTTDDDDFADYIGDRDDEPTVPADDELDEATPDVGDGPDFEPPD